ncbi:MAG TPA: S16 family serine protease [Gaiellaceae bacterium]|nr:S16 family serine protease [Gaiellaceae bacterium]
MKLGRVFTSGRLLALGLVLLAAAVALAVVPSNEYIFLPDKAHPVAPLVTVPNAHPPARGAVYFVDVQIQKATMLERLFGGWPHKGADLYPASAINAPGVSSKLQRTIDLEDMHLSQQIAAAVALKKLHKDVRVTATGALIEDVGAGLPAFGKLAPDDVITQIDGNRVTGPADVFRLMAKHKPGDTVAFTVRRANKTLVAHVKTTNERGRAIVGVVVGPAVDIHLPEPVRIDAGNVGGPSAGLAFALEVMEQSGDDVVHGHKVAATGTIAVDGTVGAIGGIKQKTYGARAAGVDTFLVPVDNAAEARKYAHGLRIIAVKNFPQALRALATLPPAG